MGWTDSVHPPGRSDLTDRCRGCRPGRSGSRIAELTGLTDARSPPRRISSRADWSIDPPADGIGPGRCSGTSTGTVSITVLSGSARYPDGDTVERDLIPVANEVIRQLTTIPAAADMGVSAAYGEWNETWGATQQLHLNVAFLLSWEW